jgi:predicted HTH domain antitoxin
MKSLLIEIPEDVVEAARIPPDERLDTIKRELAVHLYTRGILPKAAARRLSGLDRISFDHLLGQRGVLQPLDIEDLEKDLANLQTFRKKSQSGA